MTKQNARPALKKLSIHVTFITSDIKVYWKSIDVNYAVTN